MKTIIPDKPPEKWVYVEEGLQGDVSMLFELNFTYIKFVLDVAETSIQKSFHQELFNELDQYKKDQHYNLFYNTGKHAKSNLKHDKLEQLASLLELSAIQPWAANDNWTLIINEVFILISLMRKYANNLEQINQAMKKIHLSDTPAHQPANDLKVYMIESC
ncbi:828_t:CDS:2 [Cetraspora pellucida]|uniref:828_t:CDS:1 n=1 Tax=Cetraspora pellucida TaxID=1433469 RepID=A0A9N9DLL0_9GLOM|nr:828_t:CDS:2 [Cetraspora pellucida]